MSITPPPGLLLSMSDNKECIGTIWCLPMNEYTEKLEPYYTDVCIYCWKENKFVTQTWQKLPLVTYFVEPNVPREA
jgi:hypothetical protein